MKQLAYLGSMGLLVGTAAGVLVPLPERAPKAEEVALLTPAANRPSVREVPAPCPDLRAEQQAELDEAWSNLEAAEASKLDLESELAEFIGEPPSFEDYPPEFQPDAIEDAVFDMLDPEVAELEWVDCAEAPCIAILRLVGPEAQELAGMRQAADPLRDALGSDFAWEWFGVESGAYMTVPIAPHSDAATLHRRTDLREEILIRELADAGLAP